MSKNSELETLKIVFNSCQYLESIYIWCGDEYLSDKIALKMVAKFSPKNVCELKLIYTNNMESALPSEELESFFINWANRIPQKSLSLTLSGSGYYRLGGISKNLEIINKYIELGVIKKFKY